MALLGHKIQNCKCPFQQMDLQYRSLLRNFLNILFTQLKCSIYTPLVDNRVEYKGSGLNDPNIFFFCNINCYFSFMSLQLSFIVFC